MVVARDDQGRVFVQLPTVRYDAMGTLTPDMPIEVWTSQAGTLTTAEQGQETVSSVAGPRHFVDAPVPSLSRPAVLIVLSTDLPDEAEIAAFDGEGRLAGAAVVRHGHAALALALPASEETAALRRVDRAAQINTEQINTELYERASYSLQFRSWQTSDGAEAALRLVEAKRLDEEASGTGTTAHTDGALQVQEEGVWQVQVASVAPSHTSTAAEALPGAFALEPVRPNPFRQTATLHYALPEPSQVTLEVYDMRGRRVALLVAGVEQEAGYHTVPMQARGLASGLYLVRLRAGHFIQTRRMLIVQ